MPRKKLIQIGVIVVMLTGSAVVLYKGFHGSSPTTTESATTTAAPDSVGTTATTGEPVPSLSSINATAPEAGAVVASPHIDSSKILPLGTKFDLSLIKKYNTDLRFNNLPKLDPTTELNPALNDLVKQKQ